MFKVEKIIDGNTIVVNPKWNFCNESGNVVVVSGYNPIFAPDAPKKWWIKLFKKKISDQEEYEKEKFKKKFANLLAKGRLELLINEKFVELKSSRLETSNCIDKEGRMNCYVYLNSIDISVYFPDFDKLKLKK